MNDIQIKKVKAMSSVAVKPAVPATAITMPPCAVCKSPAAFLMNKDGYDLYKCPMCALIFVHPQPRPDFLSEEVYSAKSGYQANKAKDLTGITATKKQENVLAYLKVSPKGRLLDIGCSSGEFMYLAQSLGEEVFGVELNPRTAAIASANGLKVTVGTLESAKFSSGSFDYVYMADLIEHVTDPNALLTESFKLLKSGGDIVIVTPNMDCFWSHATLKLWQWLKIPWSSATPPHHLFQFSYGNLRSLVEKHGFEATYAWYVQTPTLKYELGAMHLLKKYKKEGGLVNLGSMILGYGLYTILFGINKLVEFGPWKRFDMTLIAKKP